MQIGAAAQTPLLNFSGFACTGAHLLLDSGLITVAGVVYTRTSFNIGLTSGSTLAGLPKALILELDNTNGTLALDNLNFTFAL